MILSDILARLCRQDFPRWGKDKQAVMLQRQGQLCPVSTVGRILAYLKRHGRLPGGEARGLVQVDGGSELMAEFTAARKGPLAPM